MFWHLNPPILELHALPPERSDEGGRISAVLSSTAFSTILRESTWAEPIVETVHVLMLTLFLGFAVLLDLRLLGLRMIRRRASDVIRELNPWLFGGFSMAFCQWADYTWFGHGVRDSVWLFPFVEIFHLLGLGVLGGTIVLLNLRLLNIDFRSEPTAALAKDVRPWMVFGLVVMLV